MVQKALSKRLFVKRLKKLVLPLLQPSLFIAFIHQRVAVMKFFIYLQVIANYLNRAQSEDENHRLQLLRDSGWDVRVLVWSDLRDPGRRAAWLEFLAGRLG